MGSVVLVHARSVYIPRTAALQPAELLGKPQLRCVVGGARLHRFLELVDALAAPKFALVTASVALHAVPRFAQKQLCS